MGSNERLNLYFRLAGINKGQKISQIFANKYEKFIKFHQALIENKEKIEYLIDYYYGYVNEHIIIAQDADGKLKLPTLSNQSRAQQRTAANISNILQ